MPEFIHVEFPDGSSVTVNTRFLETVYREDRFLILTVGGSEYLSEYPSEDAVYDAEREIQGQLGQPIFSIG